jgi:hypothetical protein
MIHTLERKKQRANEVIMMLDLYLAKDAAYKAACAEAATSYGDFVWPDEKALEYARDAFRQALINIQA